MIDEKETIRQIRVCPILLYRRCINIMNNSNLMSKASDTCEKRDMKYIIDCSLVKDPGAVTRYVLKNVSYLSNPFENQRRLT